MFSVASCTEEGELCQLPAVVVDPHMAEVGSNSAIRVPAEVENLAC